jgi:hypothetical protein
MPTYVYLIPGGDCINESTEGLTYLVPGGVCVNEVSTAEELNLFTPWIE